LAVVILVAATLVLPDFAVGFGLFLLPTVFLETAMVFLLVRISSGMLFASPAASAFLSYGGGVHLRGGDLGSGDFGIA
jgi:hypothetical protein